LSYVTGSQYGDWRSLLEFDEAYSSTLRHLTSPGFHVQVRRHSALINGPRGWVSFVVLSKLRQSPYCEVRSLCISPARCTPIVGTSSGGPLSWFLANNLWIHDDIPNGAVTPRRFTGRVPSVWIFWKYEVVYAEKAIDKFFISYRYSVPITYEKLMQN